MRVNVNHLHVEHNFGNLNIVSGENAGSSSRRRSGSFSTPTSLATISLSYFYCQIFYHKKFLINFIFNYHIFFPNNCS